MKGFLFLMFICFFPMFLVAQEVDPGGAVIKVVEMFPWMGKVFMYLGLALLVGWLSDVIINDKYDKGWFRKLLKYSFVGPLVKVIITYSFKIPAIGKVLSFIFTVLMKFSPDNNEDGTAVLSPSKDKK